MDRTFIDTETAMTAFRQTADGYLVGRVKCARTGIQTYRRSELGLMGDGLVNVYRPEDAVFSSDSMATYAGKPVTLSHPTVPVTSDNWKDLAVGQVGNKVVRSGDFVEVDIALMDAQTIAQVQAGTRQISMGYTTPVAMRDGVTEDGQSYQAVQTGPIRINHLAVVPAARGGSDLNIPLGDASWGATPVIVHKDTNMTNPALKKVLVDGISVETTDQGVEAIIKLQKDCAAKDAQISAKEAELATKDAALLAKDKEIADAKADVPTGPILDALVAERQALVDAAKALNPDLKLDGLSNSDIKKAVVRAVMGDAEIDAKLKGKPDAYVDAFYDASFDIASAQADSAVQTADSISKLKPKANVSDAKKDEDESYKKSVDRFSRKK